MKKLVIVALFLFSFSAFAQTSTVSYEELWQKVYHFELKALPKSANAELQKIYVKAKKDKNSAQITKSIIYRSKFCLILEDSENTLIELLKEEIKNAQPPTKNILENVLAEIYWQYLKKERWNLYRRTKTTEKINYQDFKTWGLNTLFTEIRIHYENSLQNKNLLQAIDLEAYDDILKTEPDSKRSRPTLYDFLAHNALSFLATNEYLLSKPSYQFEIDSSQYFTNFLSIPLEHKDSTSQELKTLQLYQDLSNFHQKDKDPTAFITVLLEAYNYIESNSSIKNRKELLKQNYYKLQKKYRKHPSSSQIDFKLANLFREEADRYSTTRNAKSQYKNQDALAICNKSINLFPKTTGTENCAVLRNKITNPSLKITSEKNIPSNQFSRILIDYKNLNKLRINILNLSYPQLRAYKKIRNDSIRKEFIKKLELTKDFETAVTNEKDYQHHKTEIIIPKLATGHYLLKVSEINKTKEKDPLTAYTTIQVTDLVLTESNKNNRNVYQVLDRTTGASIDKAKVNLRTYNNSNLRYKPLNKTFKTDHNGQFIYKSKQTNRKVVATIRTPKETAYFGDYYIYENYRRDKDDDYEEDILIKPFLFTDRSIYRPGQKVFFKGIFLKKTQNKTELFTNEYVEIIIENPNGEEVKTLELKLNEYGSFHGEFTIPNNGITGNYSFEFDESYEHDSKFYDNEYFDFDYRRHTISVEEYKRPKFKTEFTPITETFRLNDSITIKGEAMAFSGSKISNAKVSFRVERTAKFPFWYRRYNTSPQLEICHGETITDATGNYQITFKAIPDNTIEKKNQPTFNYAVHASVTDINGETHDASTHIKVGYHALELAFDMDSKIDKTTSDNAIFIDSKNLNNASIDTEGKIKIYKMTAPKRPMKSRIWSAPDYQNISKKEFENSFPNEPYHKFHESKGALVFTQSFNTKDSQGIQLKDIKKWKSGKYIALVECKDQYDQKIKIENEFTVFSLLENKVSDNKLFFIKKDKEKYSPNETVKLKIGTASPNMTINIDIEKNHKIVFSHYLVLQNETKTIEIPVLEKDRGGFIIRYNYVNFNTFENGSMFVSVPYQQQNLSIETISFRDKLLPGSDQKWSFKIKGNKKEKVTAEVLASMYDASLDEFKEHNWSFTPSEHRGYRSYGNETQAYNSFGTQNAFASNLIYGKNYYQFPTYDRLNWFGFSFNKIVKTNHNYIKNIKTQRKKFDNEISGVVTDESGEPIPGVSILIEGTAYGTITDFDGKYTLNIKKKDVVSYSYIGYETLSKQINETDIYNIELIADASTLEEVVIVGYGAQKKTDVTGEVSEVTMEEALQGQIAGVNINGTSGTHGNIIIRGLGSTNLEGNPLYVIDGVPMDKDPQLSISDIESIDVLKDAASTAIYGTRGANGVIVINTKSGQKKIQEELNQVQARTNLNETAFFFPDLKTDKEGNISFEFTMPEALTKWKMQLLAHTKDAKKASKTLTTITQKDLMVSPNAPRFLRKGDTLVFSSKIASLSNKNLNGFAQLELSDAITGTNIDSLFKNQNKQKSFNLTAKGNTEVSWKIVVPENIDAVQYRIVAKADDFSDGEQNVLPVLSNKTLVTETMPIWINANETRNFELTKLKNNTSKTLKHHKLTLELTSNPAWYALQALPYLIEYPYECSEQTFSKYYANTLASHVINSNPKIKEVFTQWNNSDALISNLEKNKELKSIIIQETPWLRDAVSETEQKKRIGLLFDLKKLAKNQSNLIDKLEQMQMSNGAFPWFYGSNYANRNITQQILVGFAHLQDLGILIKSKKEKKIIKKALQYLDICIQDDFQKLQNKAKVYGKLLGSSQLIKNQEKTYMNEKHINSSQLQYLYLRSYFKEYELPQEVKKAVSYYNSQTNNYWQGFSLYNKALAALIINAETPETAKSIIASLKENSTTSEELGTYWKENKPSWNWYQSPIETQSLLIEVFSKIDHNPKDIDGLKKWLLKNKQTTRWKTTKATTEAVYALLLNGTDWISIEDSVKVTIGNDPIPSNKLEKTKIEAGTGYYKVNWKESEIRPEMAKVTLKKNNEGMAWGALYWQYFEKLDKITSADTNLAVSKNIFLKQNTSTGVTLKELNPNSKLKLGDLITVRIEIKTDRNMEFVHMKDMRASGLEPVDVISGYKWKNNLGYYQSTKDASTNFFFDSIYKGKYIFEYDLRVNNAGNFSNGITTIQCMYAPEFTSHSKGTRITIK